MIMLIIQHNCRRGYKNTVMALKKAVNIRVGIALLQEFFIGNRKLVHNAFNFY